MIIFLVTRKLRKAWRAVLVANSFDCVYIGVMQNYIARRHHSCEYLLCFARRRVNGRTVNNGGDWPESFHCPLAYGAAAHRLSEHIAR
jgi:hypothetical protein